jgi:GT2 family glycosyltransferase
MTISVIIATHNRADLLDDCLTHLARQRFEPGDEVLVVDNGSTDRTAEVLTRQRADFPVPLHALHEPQPGKSRAVARAVALACGDVLAFTDDDVSAAPEWLDAIRSAMADPATALIGGPVTPRWERDAPWWLRPKADGYGRLGAPLGLLDYGSNAAPLGERTALGANLAVRRDVVATVGGFALHLGKLRGTLLSGEDHDLCRRVQSAGFATAYCPAATVAHWVPSSRMRVRYFLAWFYWSGITHAALDRGVPTGAARTVCGIPLYLIRRFAVGTAGAFAAAATLRPRAAIDRAIDAAFSAGYAAARWRSAAVNRTRRVAHPA